MESHPPNFQKIPFKNPEQTVGAFSAVAAAEMVSSTADIALVVDQGGIIRDLSVANYDLAKEGFAKWIGSKWIDTVTIESREKIEDLFDEAKKSQHGRWRQVNHPSMDGLDVPVSYRVQRLADNEHFLAFGQAQITLAKLQQRLVEAQQAIEREYSRLRHAETRYRVLFKSTAEPVLIVDANTGKIREANDAASRVLGEDLRRLAGRTLLSRFHTGSRATVTAYLEKLSGTGLAGEVTAQLAGGDTPVRISASVFRQERAILYLVRLTPEAGDGAEPEEAIPSMLEKLIDSMPDAFLVTDRQFRILSANAVFVELAQLANSQQALGENLGRWLGRGDVDVNSLIDNLTQHETVRRYATVIRGDLGSQEQVEVSGVAVPHGERPCFGFSIRPVGASGTSAGGEDDSDLRRSVERLTELVGRVPLKEIVRETTDMIERMCIEAALGSTGDNRASAADVLGLSRQSLYVKLRRHGMVDFEADGEG